MVEAYQPRQDERAQRISKENGDGTREERWPLGERPYKIAISRDEMRIAFQHREATGEPMQTWVRRLIRENGSKSLHSERDSRDFFVASSTGVSRSGSDR